MYTRDRSCCRVLHREPFEVDLRTERFAGVVATLFKAAGRLLSNLCVFHWFECHCRAFLEWSVKYWSSDSAQRWWLCCFALAGRPPSSFPSVRLGDVKIDERSTLG